jgi:hypothetical protein
MAEALKNNPSKPASDSTAQFTIPVDGNIDSFRRYKTVNGNGTVVTVHHGTLLSTILTTNTEFELQVVMKRSFKSMTADLD